MDLLGIFFVGFIFDLIFAAVATFYDIICYIVSEACRNIAERFHLRSQARRDERASQQAFAARLCSRLLENRDVDRLRPSQQALVARFCSRCLQSRRREDRLYAVEVLSKLGKCAAPILIGALHRFNNDPFLLERVARALGGLRDPRALPALRRLTANRNLSLMRAARDAVAAIEPHSVYLRSAAAPAASLDGLLHPAQDYGHVLDSTSLVRPR